MKMMQKTKNKIFRIVSYCNTRKNLLNIFSVLLPIIIMSLLTIPNLGNREMWIDEAYCVVLGKRTLEFGYPRVWDGKNFATILKGADFIGNFLQILLNIFPYYIVSFSLIFSKTIFGIRFCFVLIGLLSALFLYLSTYEYTGNKRIAYLSLWLFCLSIPVIIYIRVAQYYSPSLLFVNMSCYYLIKYIKKNQRLYGILYSISMILLFYTNYLFFGVLIIAMFLLVLLVEKSIKTILKKYMKPLLQIFILIFPYLITKIYYSITFGSTYPVQGLNGFIVQFPGYMWKLQAYFFPFITFIIMVILKIFFKGLYKKSFKTTIFHDDNIQNMIRKKEENNKSNYIYYMSIIIILINIIVISALTWDYATRYLIVSIPFCCILSSAFIIKYFEKDKVAMILFIIIFLFTNIIHELPYFFLKKINVDSKVNVIVKPPVLYYDLEFWQARDTLDSYLQKLDIKSIFYTYATTYMDNYDNSDKAAVLFSKKYIKEEQNMLNLSTSSFNIMYYTDCKIINYIKNPDSIIMDQTYLDTTRPITWAKNLKYFALSYMSIDFIDWIVVNTTDLKTDSVFLSPEIRDKILDDKKYERYDILDYPFLPFVADIWTYSFKTDYDYEGITFFRNRLTTQPIDTTNPITKEHLNSNERK